MTFHEPPIANALATIPPLPFRRGEGRGEGSVLSLRFMVPVPAQQRKEAFSDPPGDFRLAIGDCQLAICTNLSASNEAGSLAKPSAELWAIFFNWRRRAALILG